jgi:adenine deaminase
LFAEGGREMSRFEEAKKSPMDMAVMVSFCIAAYLEQSEIHVFTDEALKEFMENISEDIMEWLMQEGE